MGLTWTKKFYSIQVSTLDSGDKRIGEFVKTGCFFDLALPNDFRFPAHPPESGLGFLVSLPIPVNLDRPVFAPGAGEARLRASIVTVPEATVDKYRDLLAREHDVGCSGQFFSVESKAQPTNM